MNELTNLREMNALRDTTTTRMIDDIREFIRINSHRLRRLTDAKHADNTDDAMSREQTTVTEEMLVDVLEVNLNAIIGFVH